MPLSTHPSDVRATFEKFDRNRSGKLDYKELREALKAMGLDVSSQQSAEILAQYDTNRSGVLGLDEFANVVGRLRQFQAEGISPEMRQTFARFDRNRSGKLDYKELREALKALGLDVGSEEATSILQKYDTDRSGLLEIDEFATLVHQLRKWQQSQQSQQPAGHAQASSVPADIRDAFVGFDRNRSGKLDYKELRDALRVLGLDVNSDDATKILARYDSDRNGLMDLDEFAKLVYELRRYVASQQPRPSSHQPHPTGHTEPSRKPTHGHAISPEVRAAFQRFDRNRSGRLDYREVRTALQAMGLDVSTQQAASVLRRYDADGSGFLELDEFSGLVWQLRGELFPQKASGLRVALYVLNTPSRPPAGQPPSDRRGGHQHHGAAAVRGYERAASEARAYVSSQQLEQALSSAISQAVEERAYDATQRIAEILQQGRGARVGGVELAQTNVSEQLEQRALDAERHAAELQARLNMAGGDLQRESAQLREQHRVESAELRQRLAAAEEALRRKRSDAEADVRAAFEKFDRNRSGKLDHKELRNGLNALGIETSGQQAVELLATYDADRSGLLEIDEFVTLVARLRAFMAANYTPLKAQVEQLQQANAKLSRADAILGKAVQPRVREAFESCDKDGSGDIDAKEIKKALRLLGMQGDSQQAMGVIGKYDKTGAGSLSIFDFNTCVQELLQFQQMLGPATPAPQPAVAKAAAKGNRSGGWP